MHLLQGRITTIILIKFFWVGTSPLLSKPLDDDSCWETRDNLASRIIVLPTSLCLPLIWNFINYFMSSCSIVKKGVVTFFLDLKKESGDYHLEGRWLPGLLFEPIHTSLLSYSKSHCPLGTNAPNIRKKCFLKQFFFNCMSFSTKLQLQK